MASSLDILNAIRDVAGAEYQARIPEATRENIASVGNTVLSYQAHTNLFLTELINRIGRVVIDRMDSMEDIYSAFKDERLDFGDTIQKIFIDIPSANAFEGTNTLNPSSMLAIDKGVIHVEYTSVDRRLFYKRTISVAELKEAFTTVAKLDEFIMAIIETMSTALGLDKYVMVTNTLATHCKYIVRVIEGNATPKVRALVVPSSVATYNSESKQITWSVTGAKVFLKMLRVLSGSLKFYHELGYEAYDVENDAIPDGATLKTIQAQRTPVSQQVLGLELSSLAEIDVEALAVLFNLEKADIRTRIIELEDGALGDVTAELVEDEEYTYHIGGFLCHKDGVVRGTSFEEQDSFKNPEHQYVNMWQHYWGYMAVSKFKDFVPILFVEE